MKATRYANAVFQGGGVRGIAYAGVLENIPEHIIFRAYGGTSAGAIVAALLAVGVPRKGLRDLLDPKIFASFIDPSERKKAETVFSAFRSASNALASDSKGAISLSRAAYLLWRSRSEIEKVCVDRGFFSTEKLREWLGQHLGVKKFKDIACEDLRIVAADITNQRYVVFGAKETPEVEIADAVLASACIPIFFRPVRQDPKIFVDGGMLSNFPSYLFARSNYPTIGFKLLDFDDAKLDGATGFVKSLLLTMVNAHDRERKPAQYFHGVDIEAGAVPSTKFDLEKSDVAALLTAGRAASAGVDWDSLAREKPIAKNLDSKPDEALDFALRSASELYEALDHKESRPQELREQVVIKTRITEHYGSETEIHYEYAVEGDLPLIATRFRLFDLPDKQSIVDSKPNVERTDGRGKIVVLPAINDGREKGYVICFSPPVSSRLGSCSWVSRHRVLGDFLKLKSREDEVFSYRARARAAKHELKVVLELRIDAALPGIEPRPTFQPKSMSGPEDCVVEGRAHRLFRIEPEPTLINETTVEYNVTLTVP